MDNLKMYTFYFEIFGKKMKTTIKAKTKFEADKLLREKIIVNKCDESDPFANAMDMIKNMMKK